MLWKNIVSLKPICNFRKLNKNIFRTDKTRSFGTIKVIGCGAPGEPASIQLETCNSRLLFNCGPNLRRIAINNGIRLGATQNIFLTRSDWTHIGGLSSICKDIWDATNKHITIYGPSQLDAVLQPLAAILDLPTTALKFGTDNHFENSNIRVDFVALQTNSEVNAKLPKVVAYICELKPSDGKLSIEKCVDLGVPAPLVSQLFKNNEVTLDDGRIVKPTDVKIYADSSVSFLVIDIPSKDYLPSLANNDKIDKYLQNKKQSGEKIEFVIHFSPQDVIDLPVYQQFMRKTGANKHLGINESNKFSGLRSAHNAQVKLNALDENIFPLLSSSVDATPHEYHVSRDDKDIDFNESQSNEMLKVEPVSTLTTCYLRKNLGIINQIESKRKILVNVPAKKEKINLNDRVHIFPKIIFFGTGGSLSGGIRNATSILVHTNEDSCILLDCGEGTCGQLIRFYGNKSTEVFRKIKAVFISHMHADHNLGLLELIELRNKLFPKNRKPILLMAPKLLKSWLSDFGKEIYESRNEFIFVNNQNLIYGLANDVSKDIGVKSLHTCNVSHINQSYAISLAIDTIPIKNETFKLTFSGDTIPCDSLIKLGINSTVLIHEATFDDSLQVMANVKRHSTVSQAIEQGRAMNAKYTILTHFSQRYKIPWIDGELNDSVGIAFDNMEIIESDLCKLSGFYPKLKEIFKERDIMDSIKINPNCK